MDLKKELEAIDLTLEGLDQRRTEIVNRLAAAARKPAAIGRPVKLRKVIQFPGGTDTGRMIQTGEV